MPQAVRIHEVGGTEVLKLEEFDLPTKDAADVLIKTRSIGVVSGGVYCDDPLILRQTGAARLLRPRV